MRNWKKQVLGGVCAAAMLVTLVPATAMAADTSCSVNFKVNDFVVEYADGVKPGATCDVTIAKAVEILGDSLNVPEDKAVDYWTLKVDGKDVKVNTAAKVYEPEFQKQTLVATLKDAPKPKTFTVTFNPNYEPAWEAFDKQAKEGETVSKPADPQREGYTFAGWTTDKEGKNKFDFATPVTSNLDLYAQWTKGEAPKPQTFKVIFGAVDPTNGNTVYDETFSYKKDEAIKTPDISDRIPAGYQLIGWRGGKSGENAFYSSVEGILVKADMTFSAVFAKKDTPKETYKVTFGVIDPTDASLVLYDKTFGYKNGEAIKAPAVSELNIPAGYQLIGWRDNNGTFWSSVDGFKVGTAIKADTTFSAVLAKKDAPKGYYKVTFYWRDNSGHHVSSVNVVKNGKLTKGEVPVPGAFRGHTFYGWFDRNGRRLDLDKAVTADTVYIGYWSTDWCPKPPTGPDYPDVPSPSPSPSVTKAPVYRVYNRNSGLHHYTTDAAEYQRLVALGWSDEDVSFNAAEEDSSNANLKPVYREYNPNDGNHNWTMDKAEHDRLVSLGWTDEGVAWYVDTTASTDVYRLYNPNSGEHVYTTSAEEYDSVGNAGWTQEGVAWKSL